MDDSILDAYFAGLIDGEGNVAVYTIKMHKWRSRRPVIKVDMTCHKTIAAIHEHFGGYMGVKKTRVGTKPQWRWEVTFNKAIDVCERIRPFLITKTEGADAILACERHPVGRQPKLTP